MRILPLMYAKLTEAQCRLAIKEGGFADDVVQAAPSVAVVLTQSWCPQWLWMKTWLQAAASDEKTAIFYVEYDREPFHQEFMHFKESVFGNDQIPYVRYYRNGVLFRESNYIDRSGFLRLLGAP